MLEKVDIFPLRKIKFNSPIITRSYKLSKKDLLNQRGRGREELLQPRQERERDLAMTFWVVTTGGEGVTGI